jgi:hypothetical protein
MPEPSIAKSHLCPPDLGASHNVRRFATKSGREMILVPLWYTFLDRTRPPGATTDFSAIAYSLQVAVNLRVALNIVRPSDDCLRCAEQVLARATQYGEARVHGASQRFAEAEKMLDDALILLMIEMRNCASHSPRDRIVAIVVADILSDDEPDFASHRRPNADVGPREIRPKSEASLD